MCKVWGGTWTGAGVWVDKQARRMCYRTRTWALEDGWIWKAWKSAGLAQGSTKTTGGSLSGKSPWQIPCTTVEVVDPKKKPEEDIVGVAREMLTLMAKPQGALLRDMTWVNCQECELKTLALSWAWPASQELGLGQASTDTEVLRWAVQGVIGGTQAAFPGPLIWPLLEGQQRSSDPQTYRREESIW